MVRVPYNDEWGEEFEDAPRLDPADSLIAAEKQEDAPARDRTGIASKELRQFLVFVAEELTRQEAKVFIRYYLDGKQPSDIAQELNFRSRGTVSKHLERIRSKSRGIGIEFDKCLERGRYRRPCRTENSFFCPEKQGNRPQASHPPPSAEGGHSNA